MNSRLFWMHGISLRFGFRLHYLLSSHLSGLLCAFSVHFLVLLPNHLVDLYHLRSPFRVIVEDQLRDYCLWESGTLTPHMKVLDLFVPTSQCNLHLLNIFGTDGSVKELFLRVSCYLRTRWSWDSWRLQTLVWCAFWPFWLWFDETVDTAASCCVRADVLSATP